MRYLDIQSSTCYRKEEREAWASPSDSLLRVMGKQGVRALATRDGLPPSAPFLLGGSTSPGVPLRSVRPRPARGLSRSLCKTCKRLLKPIHNAFHASGKGCAASDHSSDLGRLRHRSSPWIVMHVEYTKRDIGELKTDVSAIRKDVSETRQSLAILSERVAHLPSKGFITTVVITVLAIGSGIVAIAPKLQELAGITAPTTTTAPPQSPSTPRRSTPRR